MPITVLMLFQEDEFLLYLGHGWMIRPVPASGVRLLHRTAFCLVTTGNCQLCRHLLSTTMNYFCCIKNCGFKLPKVEVWAFNAVHRWWGQCQLNICSPLFVCRLDECLSIIIAVLVTQPLQPLIYCRSKNLYCCPQIHSLLSIAGHMSYEAT